ncbi:hypothetical protein SALB1_3076 [Salinisphaera sp. LB1]|nr:hypothetical protein SALB1_3076 [Salinisphaera sp. LB1]
MKLQLLAVLATAGLACGVANATVINFSGSITGVTNAGSGFSAGDALTGYLDLADDVNMSPGATFGNGDGAYPDDLLRTLNLTIDGMDFVNPLTSYSGTVAPSGNTLSGFVAASGPDDFGSNCSYCVGEFHADGFSITNFLDGNAVTGELSAEIQPSGSLPVAEPSNLAMFGLAVFGIGGLVRRRIARGQHDA